MQEWKVVQCPDDQPPVDLFLTFKLYNLTTPTASASVPTGPTLYLVHRKNSATE